MPLLDEYEPPPKTPMLQVNYEEVDLRGQEVTFLIKKSLSGRIGWKGGNIVLSELLLYIYVFLKTFFNFYGKNIAKNM